MYTSDGTQYGGKINTDEADWINSDISTNGSEMMSVHIISLSLSLSLSGLFCSCQFLFPLTG